MPNIKITNKDGVTLKTAGKYCADDIAVTVDESLLGITPNGELPITENGNYDVTNYESVDVNVEADVKPKLTDVTIRPQKETVIRRAKDEGYDGYDVVYVYQPTTQQLTVTPTTETQYVEPEGNSFLSKVTVKPVTASIDSNIKPENIKEGVSILGVIGTSGGNEVDFMRTVVSRDFENVTIPDGVYYVGQYAFAHCRDLINVDLTQSRTLYSIYTGAFYYCDSLKNIFIPKIISAIHEEAFYYCSKLETVTFEDQSQLTQIQAEAFNGCSSLTSITIPDSVTTIGTSCFNGCKNLASVHLPQSLSRITNSLFSQCESLEQITIPESVTTIDSDAFSQCKSLKSINIPSNLTKINYGTFNHCSSLESVEIPDKVASIDGMAFNNCTSLKSVTLPISLQTIGYQAFSGCALLTSIIVPEGVTSMQNYALAIGSEANKATITMLSTTPPTITSNTFNKSRLSQIIVPVGCGGTYKSATNWSALADYIVEASE